MEGVGEGQGRRETENAVRQRTAFFVSAGERTKGDPPPRPCTRTTQPRYNPFTRPIPTSRRPILAPPHQPRCRADSTPVLPTDARRLLIGALTPTTASLRLLNRTPAPPHCRVIHDIRIIRAPTDTIPLRPPDTPPRHPTPQGPYTRSRASTHQLRRPHSHHPPRRPACGDRAGYIKLMLTFDRQAGSSEKLA